MNPIVVPVPITAMHSLDWVDYVATARVWIRTRTKTTVVTAIRWLHLAFYVVVVPSLTLYRRVIISTVERVGYDVPIFWGQAERVVTAFVAIHLTTRQTVPVVGLPVHWVRNAATVHAQT